MIQDKKVSIVRIFKIANYSHGIIIPPNIMKEFRLVEKDFLALKVENDKIIILKIKI